MNRRPWKSALVLSVLVAAMTGAAAGRQLQELGLGPHEVTRPFKLKAAGQVDLETSGFNFSGVATHLGRYDAEGTIDLSTFFITGVFTAANEDTLAWTATFTIGPLGELQATFEFDGGTGRFEHATGSASGPVLLDPDFMFTFTLEGTISY